MAKRTAKKSDNTLLLVGAAAVLGVAAYALWPKSAAAAPGSGTGGGGTGGGGGTATKPTVAVLAQGTGTPTGNITVGGLSTPLPAYVTVPSGDAAALYLEAYDGASNPIYGPVTAEPIVADIGASNLADASNLSALIADMKAKGSGYVTSDLAKLSAPGVAVLLWTADKNGVLNWWLTKWS